MILASLLVVLILAAASDTPMRRRLLTVLAGLKRLLPKTVGGRLTLAIAVVVVSIALFQLLKTEALAIAGPMAPEMAAWFALLDVGTAMDLFAVAVLATLTVRIKAVAHALRTLAAHVVRLWRNGRQRRRRPLRRTSRKRPEEGEPWGGAAAFG